MAEILLPAKSYNLSLLDEELKTALTPAVCFGVLGRKGAYYAHLADNAPAGSDATAVQVATAHNSSGQTEKQQLTAAQTICHNDIVAYLRAQLTSASPNTATIKATVQPIIEANPRLQNGITNTAALFGFDTTTNIGYMRAVMTFLAIMA